MHICYVSSFCNPNDFDNALDSGKGVNQAIQKFNKLLIEGLVSNKATVCAVSSPDVVLSKNRRDNSRICEGFQVKYTWNLGKGIVRLFFKCLSSFFCVLLQPKNTVVLMDVLKISGGIGALLAARIRRFASYGIVTDLPEYQEVHDNRVMYCLNNWLIEQQTGYILLTEAMNEKVNPHGKPYVVVEGFADSAMGQVSLPSMDDLQKRILYAGSLQKQYGIGQLVRAFVKIGKENEELVVYGAGDYEEQLIHLANQYPSIRFVGKRPNEEVLLAEQQAYLLVNPRTADGEYTKYSFPSKTLEYMATGVPVLMHKLPGIPKEYDDYLFYFDGSTDEEIADSLRRVLDMDSRIAKQRGMDAKSFVLSQKNEMGQARKILSFLEREN